MVDSLGVVMRKLRGDPWPGGLLIAREPLAYAGWLKATRRRVPVTVPHAPNEQPLRRSGLRTIESYFEGVQCRYYCILAQLDRVTSNNRLLIAPAAANNAPLRLSGPRSLAANAVIRGRRPGAGSNGPGG